MGFGKCYEISTFKITILNVFFFFFLNLAALGLSCSTQDLGCVMRDLSGFPGGPAVKKPPAMQEMWVRSLGQEDTLEREMATQSSILAWRIPWTEELGGLYSLGSQRIGDD